MSRRTWRLYVPEDKPYVLALHIEMETALGRTLDLPDLWEEPVVVAIVGETHGKITHTLFLEAEVELCAVGRNPISRVDVREIMQFLLPAAQRYKVRIARAFVPVQALTPDKKNRACPLRRVLYEAGFTQENQTVFQFFKFIPEAA